MFCRLISRQKQFRRFQSNVALLRNARYRNSKFSNLKLNNVLGYDDNLEDGYDFNKAGAVLLGDNAKYTFPKTGSTSYNDKLRKSHTKHFANGNYNIGKIGSTTEYDNCIQEVNFDDTLIEETNFATIGFLSVHCDNTKFKNCVYENVNFEHTTFTDTEFDMNNMIDVDFRDCTFQNVTFKNLSIKHISFYQCDLDNVKFENSNLIAGTLQLCTVTKLSFVNTELNKMKIYETDLSKLYINGEKIDISKCGVVDAFGSRVLGGEIPLQQT
jgi:uncharacterized protein YjbI with pentapeptide repeats